MSIAFAQSTPLNRGDETHTAAYCLRPAISAKEDQQYLTAMCYVSIFPMRHPPLSIQEEEKILLRLPQISPWRRGWGRTGDIALLAINPLTQQRIGAIWCRLFPSAPAFVSGFYDPNVPLVSLAVTKSSRHQGVGGSLLHAIKQAASQHGYTALSLGVTAKNTAQVLYEQHGFQRCSVHSPSGLITMAVELTVPENGNVR
ncbi:GNAT family N-acetyltransferase [Ktedonobacteria bacterium brp13]|nr:GNAT family N-acetyltransferase [Ktedonobacteria bacterium brp13]